MFIGTPLKEKKNKTNKQTNKQANKKTNSYSLDAQTL